MIARDVLKLLMAMMNAKFIARLNALDRDDVSKLTLFVYFAIKKAQNV